MMGPDNLVDQCQDSPGDSCVNEGMSHNLSVFQFLRLEQ